MPSFGMAFREESENVGPEAQIALVGAAFPKNVKQAPFWTPRPSFGMVFREESENDGPEAHIALLGRVFFSKKR